jgi:hypothetical protein
VVVLDVAGHADVSLLSGCSGVTQAVVVLLCSCRAMLPSQRSDHNGSLCAGYLLLYASCTVAQLILPVFNI